MDLFDYASELFNQHNELYVPGLGHFAQTRKSIYYNDGNLYPPVKQTTFDHNPAEENDELISYFATKKRISPASAKYFVDKLVGQLKEQANTGESEFADLGTFYTSNGALSFKPRHTNEENDPLVFGYAPVSFFKLADRTDKPTVTPPRPDDNFEEEKAATPVVLHKPNDTLTTEELKPQNTVNTGTEINMVMLTSSAGRDQQNGTSALLWTLYSVLTMIVIGALLWYYNTHTMANEKVNAENNPVNQSYNNQKAKVKIAAASKADLDTATANKALSDDSAAAIANAKALAKPPAEEPALHPASTPAAEIFKNSWVVAGGQNNNYAGAGRLLTRYHELGYPNARMIDSVKKRDYFIYRVVFGFYDTKQQAINARRQLLKDGKLKPKYITVQPTNKEQ